MPLSLAGVALPAWTSDLDGRLFLETLWSSKPADVRTNPHALLGRITEVWNHARVVQGSGGAGGGGRDVRLCAKGPWLTAGFPTVLAVRSAAPAGRHRVVTVAVVTVTTPRLQRSGVAEGGSRCLR